MRALRGQAGRARRRAAILLRALAVLVLTLTLPFRVAFAQAPPGPPDVPPAEPAPTDPPSDPDAVDVSGDPGEDEPGAAPVVTLPPTELDLARGQPIARIYVVGNRRLPVEDIISYFQRIRVGKPFSPEGLTSDVRELWDSGFFGNIQVDLERKDDGVHLGILVEERPNIREIEFVGNDEIDSEDLLEALSVEVKPGTTLSYAALRRGVQKLRDKYAEEGYFLAEVAYEAVPTRDNEVIVRYRIKENEAVTVRRIHFIGNHHVPTEELREVMLTGQSGFFDFGAGGPYRQDAFERDILVLSALYYDRGFLAVQIATPRVMLTPDRTGIEITITINEGPRFKVRSLRILEVDADGREVEPIGGRRALREMIRAEAGDWFNRAELAQDIGSVLTMYRDHGYANVQAPLNPVPDPVRREVDIVVPIQRNQLVYFNRIEIRGNTKTRDKVIRREMEVKERELFSETKLEKSKRRITALGYFERVDVSTEQGRAEDKFVDVNVEVVEKPTGQFQVGAGFSSLESFIATAQVQQANLFGNGQSLSLQAQISGLRQLIDLRIYEPYFLDSRFSASVGLYDQLRIYQQFSQNSIGGLASLGYPIIEPHLRASVTYTLEHNEVSTATTSTIFGTASTISAFPRLPLANLFNDGLTSSVRPALTYDTRNNQLFPSAGVYLQGSVEASSRFIGADNEFVRYRTTGRFYYPLTESIVLKLNSEGGLVTSPREEGVPIFARFFLGGILDVRGFPLRSVGPRLPLRRTLDENAPPIENGANIGGNLMYYQNLEFEFPIVEAVQIRGVVFTDLGNTWNLEDIYCDAAPASPYDVTNPCFNASRLLDVRTSWGFGLRWFSPLGPLRFEWGFPFSPLPYEESSRFEFTIGNFF